MARKQQKKKNDPSEPFGDSGKQLSFRTANMHEEFLEWYQKFLQETQWRNSDRSEIARLLVGYGVRALREELGDQPGMPPPPPKTLVRV